MKTNIQNADEKIVVTLVGEMDTAAAMEMEKKLQPILENKNKDIVIDCKNLEYIASSGLRILLSILKLSKNNDCQVILKDVNDDIKEVFKLTGFINIFEFE